VSPNSRLLGRAFSELSLKGALDARISVGMRRFVGKDRKMKSQKSNLLNSPDYRRIIEAGAVAFLDISAKLAAKGSAAPPKMALARRRRTARQAARKSTASKTPRSRKPARQLVPGRQSGTGTKRKAA
jgi:hypothetical protein